MYTGRPRFKEAMDVCCRNMALQHITFDDSGMAGSEIIGHAESMFQRNEIGTVLDQRHKAIRLDMLHPRRTAPACWIFIDLDFHWSGGGQGLSGSEDRGSNQQEP